MHPHSPRIFASLITSIALTVSLHAQTATAPTEKLAFEVVSIRPADPNVQIRNYGIQPTMVTLQLYAVLVDAFVKQRYPAQDLLAGVPDWVRSTPYTIEAKFDDNTAQALAKMNPDDRREALMPLLQQLLTDRCKLAYHRVPTQLQAFALVVSKGGPHLKPAVEGETAPAGLHPLADGGAMDGFHPGQLPAVMRLFHATITDLLRYMTGGVVILDQTNLTGRFNFDVPRADQEHPGIDVHADPYTLAHFYDVTGLGLELKPIKIPTDKIIIDHIEKPTPN